MSSIIKGLGGKPLYKELEYLSSKEVSSYKNVILLVIDGLGYEYLTKTKNSVLKNNLKYRITSSFPPTTATCITAFNTGVAPQQHGVSGWFMYLKELGIVVTTFKTRPRAYTNKNKLQAEGIDWNKIFTEDTIFNKMTSSLS